MKRTKKKPGRPKIPDKKIPVSVRLSPEVVRYLRMAAKPAVLIQSLVESSDGYAKYLSRVRSQS